MEEFYDNIPIAHVNNKQLLEELFIENELPFNYVTELKTNFVDYFYPSALIPKCMIRIDTLTDDVFLYGESFVSEDNIVDFDWFEKFTNAELLFDRILCDESEEYSFDSKLYQRVQRVFQGQYIKTYDYKIKDFDVYIPFGD